MAISRTKDLFLLIKSLTKAEKRTFRLYAERIRETENLNYVKLFDIMDKEKEFDDARFMDLLGIQETSRYSNYKRHLFEQILFSLRMTKKSGLKNMRVRELIDFAYVLYGKGFHMQALKILERARSIAEKHQFDFSLFTIIEFEKIIHSRHITRTAPAPMNLLMDISSELSASISNRAKLSNLRLLLHRYYIKHGHVKDEAEEAAFIQLYQEKLSTIEMTGLSRKEKIHVCQARVWYHYVLNDFESCEKYAQEWVDLFDLSNRSAMDINLFFRAYHYLLVSHFNLVKTDAFNKAFEALSKFRKTRYAKFDENTKILSFLYVHQGRMNKYILEEDYEEGIKQIPRTLRRLSRYANKLDHHKVMIFHFKIAWLYLMGGRPWDSVTYLNSIINLLDDTLRLDIQLYARLMNLMAQLDMENLEVLPSLLRNYKRFIVKHDMMQEAHRLFMEYIKVSSQAPLLERKAIREKYVQHLKSIKENKYEKRAFLYLDMIKWMER